MTRRVRSPASHASIARIALIAFTLRALIPAGFMPSAGHPFTLSICPEGLTVGLPAAAEDGSSRHAHAGHAQPHPATGDSTGDEPQGHTTQHTTHCDFAVAVSAPRPADITLVTTALEIASLAPFEHPSPSQSLRFLLAQPRAPPTFV